MGDGGDTTHEPWGGGVGEAGGPAAAKVDTAIRDVRRAVFPLLGLDPDDPRD
jgi:acetoin utilization protein AcuC